MIQEKMMVFEIAMGTTQFFLFMSFICKNHSFVIFSYFCHVDGLVVIFTASGGVRFPSSLGLNRQKNQF